MKQLELKDFLQYRFLSNVKYAPNGKRAAFVVSNCKEDAEGYESRLWLWDGQLRQLTDLGAERSFLWEDDTHILFPAVRSEAEKKRREAGEQFTSYYRLDLTGGEAIHAFTLPFACSRLEQVDGGWAALGALDARHPDYYDMNEVDRADVAKEAKEEADYEVLDEIPFWGNGQGFTNKQRTALFFVDPEFHVRRITAPTETVGGLVCRGDQVFFAVQSYETKYPLLGCQIRKLEPRTGKANLVLDVPDLAVNRLHLVGNALWLSATDGEVFGMNQNDWIYTLKPETCCLEVLREETHSMYSAVNSDCRYGGGAQQQVRGSSLYYVTTREGSSHLYCLTADGQPHPVVTRDGCVEAIALSEQTEEALLIAMYDGKLQELYAADLTTGQVRQLTHFNDAVLADKYVADYQPLTVESCGETIGGWVLLPKNYNPLNTYPAILDIHGGPKTVYGPVFYHEMQLWANRGYFVFFCNPKGSDGRDNGFADIRGHYGETDYQNIMDFTDAVLEAYPQIDRSRVCVTGGSYGGFMTNWIIGHTDRFCCAASQRSISNWLSFYGVSDIGCFFAADQCAGDIYNDPKLLWDHSPLKYAAQVKTPTLFIHSDEDYRCPLEQGLQMYTALMDRGVQARMCLFHGENHDLSRTGKPRHRIRRLEEITNWFEKYTER